MWPIYYFVFVINFDCMILIGLLGSFTMFNFKLMCILIRNIQFLVLFWLKATHYIHTKENGVCHSRIKNLLIHENANSWLNECELRQFSKWNRLSSPFAAFIHSALTCLLLCRTNNGIQLLWAPVMQNVPNRRCRTKVLTIWAFVLSSVSPPSIRRLIYALESFWGSKLVNVMEWNNWKIGSVGSVSAWWYQISNVIFNMINNYHKTHKLLYQIVIQYVQCLHSQFTMNSISFS